ncbi:MAG TPA: YhbY family RNA-binding protein [Candidatus Cloacimonadota bacterium]|nr:YhbY family RNA-binding protein [Candidatus Cloacimonadota bacterium]
MKFTGKQKAQLKSIGQNLEIMVRVGEKGVTPSVVASLNEALEAHELIKISVQHPQRDIRKDLIAELAEQAEAQIISTIGKTALLFKVNQDNPVISERL